MADKGTPLSWLNEFGFTIHEVLRYGYGGLLAYLVAALVDPVGTTKVVEAIGATISVLLAFALGGAIYVVYRPLVGESLYLLHECIHWLLNRGPCFCTRRGAYFMREWGLPLSHDRRCIPDSARRRSL